MNRFGMKVRCHQRLLFGLAFILLLAFPALLLSQAYFGTVAGLGHRPLRRRRSRRQDDFNGRGEGIYLHRHDE